MCTIQPLWGTPFFGAGNANPYLKKVESIQYKAARIITGAWKGSNMIKLYENLGWESLSDRRVMRKLCIIFETLNSRFPRYLHKVLEKQKYSTNSRFFNQELLKTIPCKRTYKLSFFPSTILDWNKLDANIKKVKSKTIFKKRLINKIRPKKHSYYGLSNDKIRYLTMLRMDLSPLRAHKFKYGFCDTSDACCMVCDTIEDTEHFLLHCKSYMLTRNILMQKISVIMEVDVSTLPKRTLVSILLYGKEGKTLENHFAIFNLVTEYIEKSKRLEKI